MITNNPTVLLAVSKCISLLLNIRIDQYTKLYNTQHVNCVNILQILTKLYVSQGS